MYVEIIIIPYHYLSLLLIIIIHGPGPGPAPPYVRGPRCRPPEGPGGPSAEGPSERAQRMGWGRACARAQPMNNNNK